MGHVELVPNVHVWGSLMHRGVGIDWVRHWPAVWEVWTPGTEVFGT